MVSLWGHASGFYVYTGVKLKQMRLQLAKFMGDIKNAFGRPQSTGDFCVSISCRAICRKVLSKTKCVSFFVFLPHL